MSNLFTTVHGSRLYGFHHDASDFDLFTVTDDSARRVRQHVTGRIDVTNVGLNHAYIDTPEKVAGLIRSFLSPPGV